MGAVPAEDATLEALHALRACRTVYADLPDPAARAWLGKLCAVKTARTPAEILKEARHSLVGLAVWGHPLFNGALAPAVIEGARAAKIPCEIFSGISPLTAWLTRAVAFFGGEEGCKGAQAVSLETALAKPALLDVPLPLVVYSTQGGRWRKLAKELSKRSAPGRKLGLYVLPSLKQSLVAVEKLGEPGGALVFIAPAGADA